MELNIDSSLTNGNNNLAFQIFKELGSEKENILLCPLSLNIILGILLIGSSGDTSREISKLLQLLSLNESTIITEYEKLINKLQTSTKITLSFANKLYLKENYKIIDTFKHTINETFKADIENINFNDTTHAIEIINKWIAIKTNGNINSVINSLDENDLMILINTIYFNGKWEQEFTYVDYPLEFKMNVTSEIIEVPQLFIKNAYYFYEDDNLRVQILEIPYEDPDFCFTILLPYDIDGLLNLERQLPIDYDNKLEREVVKVNIPMFQMEQTYQFTELLQKFGMKTAISDFADLTRMHEKTEVPMKISKIFQKTRINVNEKGTEASTATPGIGRMKLSMSKKFTADHPFIYLIKHKSTKTILYLGRYKNPKKLIE